LSEREKTISQVHGKGNIFYLPIPEIMVGNTTPERAAAISGFITRLHPRGLAPGAKADAKILKQLTGS
jgi:hypothetical protein